MTELKPVHCGCGGEAKAMSNDSHLDGCIFHFVKCAECGIDTAFYDTEAEAITAWNKAMGANHFREGTKMMDTERTAKVPYCPERYYCDDALKLMVMDIFGDYIYATHDIDLEKLREALNTLLERDQRIMFMRYQNCETLENIGKEFGVTRERIRQIIARALRILRHPKFKIVKAIPTEPEERTAKATRKPEAFFYRCECGYGLCCEKNDMNYCPHCGARLEWE